MKIPTGFYYHYKHTSKDINNYAYEVIGVGVDTESGIEGVIYRPLYTSDHLKERNFYIRPFDMFVGDIEKDGKTFPRFIKISDAEIISKLEKIRKEMYGV